MATTTTQTPKERYVKNLNSILQSVMEINGLGDGVWKEIADRCKDLYDMTDLFGIIEVQTRFIQDNRYYRERVIRTRQRLRIDQQNKVNSEKYTNCKWCDRIIKNTYMDTHLIKTKVCVDIQLVKTLTLKHKTLNHIDIKRLNLIQHNIMDKLRDAENREVKGMWEIYNEDCECPPHYLYPMYKWKRVNGKLILDFHNH